MRASFRRFPVMRQTWRDIVWCHWPVPVEQVQALLPDGLTPDLFDGQAWVGLIPFAMRDLRLPGFLRPLSKLMGVSNFGEVNVRTYVRGPDGLTGVWFCTLDSDRWLAVKTANVAFGLPYRYARTQLVRDGDVVSWYSQRRGDQAIAQLDVIMASEPWRVASPGLEQFFVERYSLYTKWCGLLLRGELHHNSWRVRSATLRHVVTETVEAEGFSVTGEPHVLAGEPVNVTIYPLRRVHKIHLRYENPVAKG